MSSPDHAAVVNEIVHLVARLAPQHVALAQRTLARLEPERWQIEWYLPWWLGESFGLDPTHARTFVLSNVLGLVTIRLQDDLADGEVAENAQAAHQELAHLLHQAALDAYRPHFPAAAVFWERVNTHMKAWRAATATVNQLQLMDLQRLKNLDDTAAHEIAALGAPLKICVDAICHLTAHPFDADLDAMLDHAFLAAVLHDHVIDCDSDLRAGRWNLFAATISNLHQTPSRFQEHRIRLNAAWMTTDTPRTYFEQIAFHLDCAQALNQRFGIKGFDTYLAALHTTIWRTYNSIATAYRADLARATKTIFGPTRQPAPKRSRKGGETSATVPIR